MIAECIPPFSRNSTVTCSIVQNHPTSCVYLDYNYAILHYSNDELGCKLTDIYNKFLDLQLPTLIIDSSGEAPSLENFPFIVKLKEKFPTLNIIHITTGWSKSTQYYTTVTNPATFFWPMRGIWTNKFLPLATHHYIALARNPKPHRTRFINSLLNRHLEKYGYYSIGSGVEWSRIDYTQYYAQHQLELGIDDANLKYFPTFLDGAIEQNYSTDPISYTIDNPKITNALVNVVLETSYEKINDGSLTDWSTPMITEKTVKAFALKQIPMILGPLGQVSHTRKLGFDMFDDVVDHSYDFETDPFVRIEKFVNSLQNFITLNPLETLQATKNKLMPRFDSNFKLATDLAATDLSDLINPVLNLFVN
jgi:hypothetical protein